VTSRRLPSQPGEWIDRETTVTFSFEGRSYTGYAGDTISSALMANGVRMLGRSFKFHRARGVYSFAGHDSNVLLQDGAKLNVRGDITPIAGGEDFRAVNTIGGLEKDRAHVLDHLGQFFPVGFYYKAFHKPRRLFPAYERKLREMSGLGVVDTSAPRQSTAKAYDFCDVLVVGGGPAGLSAAIAAAEAGARVTLADECARLGGSLTYQWTGSASILDDLLAQAHALPNLHIRLATQAVGCYADNWIALANDARLTKVRARSVVFATGCFEQPAVFGNNDLPGVMLASAAQRLVHRYAVKPFERVIVLAANADAYRAAADLHSAGIEVVAIVDLRPEGEPTDALELIWKLRIPVYAHCAITEALPNRDGTSVRGALIAPLDDEGNPRPGRGRPLDADGIVVSVGWTADWIVAQAGGKVKYSEEQAQFLPENMPPGTFAAGRINGIYELDAQMADGVSAGAAAATYSGKEVPEHLLPRPSRPSEPRSHAFPIYPHPKEKSFVDFDKDVEFKDILHAKQEGFDSIELLKRYSRFGVGPSQGKLANANVVRILAKARGQSIGATGTTTARPFVSPVPMSHLAGRGFQPHRRTALHEWHIANGAVMMPAGDWERPAYYQKDGVDREGLIAGEVRNVRSHAGIIDVGTLGKILVNGPQAGEFLDRIYTGRFARMKAGTARYGLMCDEGGVIIDDGVVARLAADRFYITTTTTAAASVYREMQRWAIIWGLDVVLANATGAHMAMNLAGPASRDVLQSLTDIGLSETAFPYMGMREGIIYGVPVTVMRVGFVGELGYEIHCDWTYGQTLWRSLIEFDSDLAPFGVEAQRVLRLEKGHVIVGQDTDGLSNPFEAGLGGLVKDDKPFFVGQRTLRIMGKRVQKRKLAGFRLPDGDTTLGVKECHLVIEGSDIAGRVTSITLSPTLGYPIGLVYLPPDRTEPGTTFQIRTDDGAMVEGTVVEVPFYHPSNLRQKVN